MAKDILLTDYSKTPHLLSLESQILTQYQQLAIKLNKLADEIRRLNNTKTSIGNNNGSSNDNDKDSIDNSATLLVENLRDLESKLGLVYTFFQSSIYSMLMQREAKSQQHERDQLQEKDVDPQSLDYNLDPYSDNQHHNRDNDFHHDEYDQNDDDIANQTFTSP